MIASQAANWGAVAAARGLQMVRGTYDAVRAQPSRIRVVIDWNQDATASFEEVLTELVADRAQGEGRLNLPQKLSQ